MLHGSWCCACHFSLGGIIRIWPKKLGELLFGSLNYANSLTTLPRHISYTVYGMLAVRTIGCIVLRMVIDGDGCHVFVVHEGGRQTTAPALEYLASCIKK